MWTQKTFRGAGQGSAEQERRSEILADTSVWIRFLANRMPYAAELERLLERDEVAGHDLVDGELLIGDSVGRSACRSCGRRYLRADTQNVSLWTAEDSGVAAAGVRLRHRS